MHESQFQAPDNDKRIITCAAMSTSSAICKIWSELLLSYIFFQCKDLYCDNTTNFIGASKHLCELGKKIYSHQARHKITKTAPNRYMNFILSHQELPISLANGLRKTQCITVITFVSALTDAMRHPF